MSLEVVLGSPNSPRGECLKTSVKKASTFGSLLLEMIKIFNFKIYVKIVHRESIILRLRKLLWKINM